MWRFGFWWGIGLFLAGLTVTGFVKAVNEVSATSEHRPRRKRDPALARVHSLATGVVGAFLGFGAAAALGLATGGLAEIAAVVATYLVLQQVSDLVLRADWSGALGSWCLVMLVWAALAVPLSAWLAPGYAVHGIGPNGATVVLVMAAELLAWRASPWRDHWSRPDRPSGSSR